jgi:RNA polymerase sigma factor (sigma-70 family)
MKVVIHNEHLLTGKNQTNQIEETIKKQYKWFEKINNMPGNDSLHTYLAEHGDGIKATLYLKQNNQQIFAEAEGSDPALLVEKLMTRLRSMLLRQVLESKKSTRVTIAKNHLSQLNKLNKQGDRDHFIFLTKELLPTIRGFVSRYVLGRKIKMPAGFTMDDLVDEIYLAIFERFNECPQKADEFSAWCFQIAQETIEDFIDKNQSEAGSVSIDELALEELKGLEENYTVDADGELVMMDELDEESITRSAYGKEILTDDALIDLPQEVEIDPVVKEVLASAEPTERMAFQLFWLHEMNEKEIAKALRLQIEMVENAINEITEKIASKLKGI